jgi:predicted fused transcriptional regulator/phosphomethylpyrimidine kinase
VNYYLKKKDEYVYKKVSDYGLTPLDLKNYVKQISVISADSELVDRCLLCGYELPGHILFPPEIGYECFCSLSLGISKATDTSRRSILNEIEQAVSLLSSSETFPQIMPEVSVNIVRALPKPKSELDIASIPGRIVKIRGRARSLAKPEFGVSNHMARVLLAAVSYNEKIRAAMNISYNNKVEDAMNALGLKILRNKKRDETEPRDFSYGGDDIILESVKKTLARSHGNFEAIVDEGGFGLEPNVYLFGPDALSISKIALQIADAVTSSILSSSSERKR